MEAIYGASWTTRHSSIDAWLIAKEEWSKSLAKYTHTDIIGKSLEHLRQNTRTFPPNLPEFLEICRQYEPKKPSSGFHEANDEFINRYYNHIVENTWDENK